jgi:glycosyltransferase involved in cell wall biosynthesis
VPVTVSIVVPVFNAEHYLEVCLGSLKQQSLQDVEFLLVDDGSTDGSRKLLEEFAASDPRAKVIAKTNAGLGHTLNVGIDHARGEYIGIVEPDDYIALSMFQRLYHEAKAHDLDVAKSDFWRVKGEGSTLKREYVSTLKRWRGYANKVLCPGDDLTVFSFYMNTWTGIYRRSFVEKHNIRHHETPGASFQDNGFYWKTFCHAERLMFIPEAFYHYRCDNPASSINSPGKVDCMREEYDFIRKFIDSDPSRFAKFLPAYWLRKFGDYIFTYERIAENLRRTFLDRFASEFAEASEKGELRKDVFAPTDWACLQDLMRSQERFHEDYFAKAGNAPLRAVRRKARRLASWVTDYGPGRCIEHLVRCMRSAALPKRILRD